jgi:hypothetical protein
MITIREIVRGAVTRFLPTAGTGALAILLAFDGRNVSAIRPAGWALLAGLLLAETTGFAALLWRTRYRLEGKADVAGRRSVVAGALGIVGLFVGSILSQGAAPVWPLLLGAASGALAGAITFWPWMRRPVSEQELEAWEAVDVAALPGPPPAAQKQSSDAVVRVQVRDRNA